MYRALPSVRHSLNKWEPLECQAALDAATLKTDPNPGRWAPLQEPKSKGFDFVDGLRLFGKAGDAAMGEGLAVYQYASNASMVKRSMCFADGDVLVVPEMGRLLVQTEFGELVVEPTEIVVVPRGIKWSIRFPLADEGKLHRGYAVEVFNEGGFRLPELGPVGANGLASPFHFKVPLAKFDVEPLHKGTIPWEHVLKVNGDWFQTLSDNSPYDVVAWRSQNYFPFKYDLKKFQAINSVSYDHPDPSIFTVLTVPSSVPGMSALDFVIFPPRWIVAEHTFRPPFFHRNTMCEFMGLIRGTYDGKMGGGFVPGGSSLHNRYTPHGPDAATVEAASSGDLVPKFFDGGLAFMFETCYSLKLSEFALNGTHRETDYSQNAWGKIKRSANL